MPALTRILSRHDSHRGQALLLVLFAMAVILTAGLAPLSRSVSDIKITEQSEEASRAFSAAEAGLERALIGVDANTTVNIGGTSVTTQIVNAASGGSSFPYPGSGLSAGQTATLWLTGHDASGNLTCAGSSCFSGNSLNVCWGSGTIADPNKTPAIEVAIFSTSNSSLQLNTIQVNRLTFDPYNSRPVPNSFSAASGSSNCHTDKNYNYSTGSITLPAGRQAVLAQVSFFYNNDQAHPVAFDVTGTGGTLPSQGQLIQARGTAGSATQTVQVFRSFPTIPSLFTTVVSTNPSSGDIRK